MRQKSHANVLYECGSPYMGMWWDFMLVHVTYVYISLPAFFASAKIRNQHVFLLLKYVGSSVGLGGVLEEKDPTKLK